MIPLINKTPWDGKDLRRLIDRVYVAVGPILLNNAKVAYQTLHPLAYRVYCGTYGVRHQQVPSGGYEFVITVPQKSIKPFEVATRLGEFLYRIGTGQQFELDFRVETRLLRSLVWAKEFKVTRKPNRRKKHFYNDRRRP